MPSSSTGYYQQPHDNASLQREYNAINKKLNYVMNSIRTFWSPELKKERQLRQEETMRLNSLQNKICQQAVRFFPSITLSYFLYFFPSNISTNILKLFLG